MGMDARKGLWGVLLGVRSVWVSRIYIAIMLSSGDNGRVGGHCCRLGWVARCFNGWGLRPTARAATVGRPRTRMAATHCARRLLSVGGGAPRRWLRAPFFRRPRRRASRLPSLPLARRVLSGSFVVSVCCGLLEACGQASSIEKTHAASAVYFFDVCLSSRRRHPAAALCWAVGGWLGGGGVAASGHPPPAAQRLVVYMLMYVKNLVMSKKSRIFAL